MKVFNQLHIRILSHNIRYATDAPFVGEEKWEVRRPRLINELCYNTTHCAESIICLQEVLHRQLLDILAGLNSDKQKWTHVGVGREDGCEAGEYSPIIYCPQIWKLKTQKSLWLSETPDRPSRGWDAASIRILTIAEFQHRSTHRTLVAMNTHLDDQGSKSRLESARMILEEIHGFTDQSLCRKDPPIFLAGDFNSEPDQEAYNEITSNNSPMADVQTFMPDYQRYGDVNTFTGFSSEPCQTKRIDFIFVNKDRPSLSHDSESLSIAAGGSWLVQGYAVLPNRFEDGVYNSDHRAVVGDLTMILG